MRRLLPLLLLLAVAAAAQIDQPQSFRAQRSSSYRANGANRDAKVVPPGQTFVVADLSGPGRIVHTWFTLATNEPRYLETTWLRIYFDGDAEPAVEAPFGAFHALGHGRVAPIRSRFVTVVARPELNANLANPNVAGFNAYFPMPFARGARVEIENRSAQEIRSLYYQIDWQQHAQPPSTLRFHARFAESPIQEPIPGAGGFEAVNPDGADNHLILETRGRGHLVGLVLSVDALRGGWWEGDEMFWIDGEAKPSVYGTGTEDYFGGAWGFRKAYTNDDHGLSYLEKLPWRQDWQAGRYTMYRWHDRDPIPFQKSIKLSIERGHNNSARDSRYTSVVYWYQQP
ncbi:MAG: DUF2961 domain-containing protein [Acidobacteria bacterium]|nr:DUF2961 domain-containing protein [Acidobacteriota bacterium]